MVKVLNMFRAFSMKNVNGYNNLYNWQKNIFDKTYKKHLASMPLEERINYTECCIRKIEGKVSVLTVSFENGDSFFYLPENEWVKITENP